MHLDGHLPIDQHSAAASFNFGQIDKKEERSWTDGSRQLGAVAGAAAAGVGREGAGAEGPAGEVAIDVVAAAGVHTAARVGRRAAPAPLAQLERLVRRHRLRRRRRRWPVHHALHRHVLLLLR